VIFFSSRFSPAAGIPATRAEVSGMRGRGILHESELSLISDFLQFIVVERVSPEQLALGPNQAFVSIERRKTPVQAVGNPGGT
jgi:hypothetical protein